MDYVTEHDGYEQCRDVVAAEVLGILIRVRTRDIGQSLGKQKPARVFLRAGCTGQLGAGIVAAAEIQWPHRKHRIGIDDNSSSSTAYQLTSPA